MSEVWRKLDKNESKTIWDKFYSGFGFRPSVNKKDWPGIIEPKPSITYNILTIYGEKRPRAGYPLNKEDAERYKKWEIDLNKKTLSALRSSVPKNEGIYALDWQHTCYYFNLHENSFKAENVNSWLVPVFPNGDYYIFYYKPLKLGLFGHPWEGTICVFGDRLIRTFKNNMPLVFKKAIRNNL